MDVLGARWRTGESFWTFSNRPAIVRAAKALEENGYLTMMSPQVERSFRASLTEQGIKEVISEDYTPPFEREARRERRNERHCCHCCGC